MASSTSPLVTPLSRLDGVGGPITADGQRLAELRMELQHLSETVSQLTAQSAARIEQMASAGITGVRSNIETRPWTAVGAALLAGVILAMVVVPRKSLGIRFNDRSTYNLDDISATARSTWDKGVNTQPLVSRFQRLMDSISTIDPATVTASPAYESAKNWLQSLTAGVRKT